MATTARSSQHVRDIMTPDPVCVDGSMTLRELARMFVDEEISGAPVIDSNGHLIGVVSKTDLVRRCLEGEAEYPPAYLFEMLSEQAGEETELRPEHEIVVDQFMTTEPLTATAGERAADVAHRMAEARVHRVVVVDRERRPVGIITSLDLLKAFPGEPIRAGQ